jgi:decaprenyl-phosphate phosphoribosyltransferase
MAQEARGLETLVSGFLAAGAFALASSACYVVNDLLDAEQDRAHPRKRLRPIASGAVTKAQARWFAAALIVAAAALLAALPAAVWLAVSLVVGAYVANVWAYSLKLKHIVIADVMSLALGFVLRMLGGCAAVEIAPTSWLLNCTFFLAMFLAFGKRLGERRTMGLDAATVRGVHAAYTDDLLRMAVVVTGVATLITYAGYVQFRADENTHVVPPFHAGINMLWFTMVPATYALLRSIVLLERGTYDDPTELVVKDWPMKIAAGLFALLSAAVLTWNLWSPW